MQHADVRIDDWLAGRYLEKRLRTWQRRRHDILKELEADLAAAEALDVDELRGAVDVAFHLVDELRNYALCIEGQAGELCERLRDWEVDKQQPGAE